MHGTPVKIRDRRAAVTGDKLFKQPIPDHSGVKGKREAINQKSEYFPPSLAFRSPAAEAGEACGLSRVEGLRETQRALRLPFSLGV